MGGKRATTIHGPGDIRLAPVPDPVARAKTDGYRKMDERRAVKVLL